MEDWDLLREQMVRNQIERRGIHDSRILEVFRTVPRHIFVPEPYRHAAYEDRPLPIGNGQTISQPYIVALMTQLMNVQPDESILEIGSGSGYQAAILSRLAARVYSVERIKSLAQQAEKNLSEAGCSNVKIFNRDGSLGLEEYSPFDGVLITAGAPSIPQPLIDQLKAGGKLVIPVGSRTGQMLKRLIKQSDGSTEIDDLIPVMFVPLKGKHGWSGDDFG